MFFGKKKSSRKRMVVGSLIKTGIFLSIIYLFWGNSAIKAVTHEDLLNQIDQINEEVQQKKNNIQSLDEKITRYRGLIAGKKLESASLQDQLTLLDEQTTKTSLEIDVAEEEIKSLNLQINRLDIQISNTEEKMIRERGLLTSLARRLYRQEISQSALEIFLTHETFADFFDELYATISLQKEMEKTLKEINKIKLSLDEERDSRTVKMASIQEHKTSLGEAKRRLEDERIFQKSILEETKASELEYRYLLADLKSEQDTANADIQTLEKTLREKISESKRNADQVSILSWPIDPSKGLTTTFHDVDYPFRYIFEHPGIDIRAKQGSPVKAAAAGVVARAKDAGLGYSYVFLIHNNNFSTVYGHLSKIIISEDSFVERGEIIGYSGGSPGTPGAGKLTTGPHLHFEAHHNGFSIDPLKYLVKI